MGLEISRKLNTIGQITSPQNGLTSLKKQRIGQRYFDFKVQSLHINTVAGTMEENCQ